jgi:hypothetical protein
MGTAGIDWDYYRHSQQQRRVARLGSRVEAIGKLKRRGYEVQELTPYQFRINGLVDLYPIHNRWHNLHTGERGGAKDLAIWIKEHLKPTERKAAYDKIKHSDHCEAEAQLRRDTHEER